MSDKVEAARLDDFLSIAALDGVAWGEQTFIVDGEHVWRVWCQYATVLVVRFDAPPADHVGDVAGALVMFPTNEQSLFLHKIMVHPQYRGRGIGTLLMAGALVDAHQPVLLTVDPKNESAIALYRKHGFVIREHVKGYYRPNEDRHLMVYQPQTVA